MDLSCSIRDRDEVKILDLQGRVVLGEECGALREEVQTLLAAEHKRILLNLNGVSRVDSSGIGVLIEAVILTAQEGGRLKLLNVPRLVYNALVVHRLLPAFEVFSSEDEAVASFR